MNGRSKRTGEESCDGPLSDRQLLKRFADHGDEDAFAELVSRYGGLVLGVCRRTLRDEHSAEDAFQATFLVLARRASRIRNRSSLAGWLYAVAYRTAVRANARRHRRREEALPHDMTATDDTLAQVTSRYEQQLLDEEIHRLPPKYRDPLVFRYLMGKSNNEIARELGVRLGVVEGRLKRAKDRLRLRLVRRGISITATLAAAAGAARVLEAATPDSLVAATVQTAAAFRTGSPSPGSHSQNAIRLAQKELAMSAPAVATTTSVAAIALVIAGLTLAWAGDGGQPPPTTPGPDVAATIQTHWPATLSIAGGPAPVRLAMAEDQPTPAAPAEKPSTVAEPEEAALDVMPRSGSGAREALWSTLTERRRGTLREMYDKVDFRSMSPGELRIRAALDAPTEWEFIETPLSDVLHTVEEFHAITIQPDVKAFYEVGIPADCPITRAVKGVRLRTALTLVLRDLDLAFVVLDDVLLITTPKEADAMLQTHVYSLHRLPGFDSETVAKILQATVCPDTWRTGAPPDKAASQNAPSAATDAPKTPPRGIVKTLPGGLVITQSQRVHDEILPLLSELERFRKSAEVLPKISEDRAAP
ncbi:MAG TPA: sigma-70 family RNA polymerase sigma factor [Thermoguttaceae bacterium]|nr:sigma-70 family RNA polymerase sigma factor [Thermoguttaceae bacterium]